MGNRYYLCLFNQETWHEFLSRDEKIYGTTKNKLPQARKIKNSDYLICYVTKRSRFVGILQKNSDTFYDESKIWETGEYPVRFTVNVVYAVSVGKGIPILKLRHKLSLCEKIKNKKRWASFFINSFNEFSYDDGNLIMNELRNLIESTD